MNDNEPDIGRSLLFSHDGVDFELGAQHTRRNGAFRGEDMLPSVMYLIHSACSYSALCWFSKDVHGSYWTYQEIWETV